MQTLIKNVFFKRWISLQGGDVSLGPILVLLIAAIAVSYWMRPDDTSSETLGPVYFSMCGDGPRLNCVVDGDTIWANGDKVRLADIDAPEVFSPKCRAEKELGRQATLRLAELLNTGEVELAHSGTRETDRYGRTLRIARVDGRSVGRSLVSEGLAHKWGNHRQGWCQA
ncbi:thermonuclease family protein [Henriciella litoralis]|uniref:thermonuclease family protein n=1 Tax=Henriciella litoralis TaxID=568102 RepID=UPI001F1901C8|nr:thermonuclease family protein [Henriciella litoralis]